ncbi:DIP1984 family protein [Parabacteroides distasonis]|uniref:DIP1984 family protein n=2 Tax=Parabacteroides distasonis TaxID=823 RepID=A0AAW6F8U2_PARDI|nr:DIP1984 family protein [Parabacteroides distasonis]MDB9139578.1 DIP1984 family protein [Parabacteroides distasonis]MDB9144535.1 DIP1984 family protein [Parabacteroides distasonis]
MKLAEALSLRADLQKRISQLEVRLKNNARIQEGEEPAEDPRGLMDELNNNLNDLETLIFRINRTNMATLTEGTSLTEMIAKKDILALRISVLRSVTQSATGSLERYSANEIRYVRTINVADLQKEIDSYSKQLRELDVKIQQLNWLTELI